MAQFDVREVVAWMRGGDEIAKPLALAVPLAVSVADEIAGGLQQPGSAIRVRRIEPAPCDLEAVHCEFSRVLTVVDTAFDVAQHGRVVLSEERLEGGAS